MKKLGKTVKYALKIYKKAKKAAIKREEKERRKNFNNNTLS